MNIFPLDAASRAPIPLLDVAAVRRVEASAQATLPPFTLMSRAGTAAADWLPAHAPQGLWLFLAGPGNNGGDALVAATCLHLSGYTVEAWLTGDPARLPPDAARAYAEAGEAGVPLQVVTDDATPWPGDCTALVDGLLGIGLNRPAEGAMARWIARLNDAGLPVFALDIPSGLHADTGAGEPAVRACRTLTFIAAKPGLLTLDGRDCAGDIDVAPIDLLPNPATERTTGPLTESPTELATESATESAIEPPAEASNALAEVASVHLNTPAGFAAQVPGRRHAVNKGTYGTLAVIGGSAGMTGAPLLGARAALLLGAGKVLIGFLAEPAPQIDPLHPELMLHAADTIPLDSLDAIVLGPGMGTAAPAQRYFARLLDATATMETPPALVLDADALNLLAADRPLAAAVQESRLPRVMTPHPLEAARLLGKDVADVQRDRLAAARALAAQWRAVVVLKGSGSVIAAPDGAAAINATGNAALATAGTGDVLAGMIGALLAQGMPPREAAQAGVWLHGRAADRLVASGVGPAGVTASELCAPARLLFNVLLRGEPGV